MRVVITCAFTLAVQACLSQVAPVWHQGSVVLDTRKVLVGEVALSPSNELILFRYSGNPISLPAYRVESFRYFDEVANINRQFLSTVLERRPKFYEVVVQGEVKLVRTPRSSDFLAASSEVSAYHYFIVKDNRLEPVRKFRSGIYPALISEQASLIELVGNQHLHLYELASIIKILREYNHLHAGRMALASTH